MRELDLCVIERGEPVGRDGVGIDGGCESQSRRPNRRRIQTLFGIRQCALFTPHCADRGSSLQIVFQRPIELLDVRTVLSQQVGAAASWSLNAQSDNAKNKRACYFDARGIE